MEPWKYAQEHAQPWAHSHSSVFVLQARVWVAEVLFIEMGIGKPVCLCCFRATAERMLEKACYMESPITQAELSVSTPLGGAFLTGRHPVEARSWLESLNDSEMHATVYLLNMDRQAASRQV